TVIECELEALDVGVRGQRITTGGASTVLSIIPDGSTVKRGDVLCVLDASDYEELLRTQQINVDRAVADHLQADLNLQVARTAVREYREGLLAQNLKTMEGEIALAQSEYERTTDRLKWTRGMVEKGYLPKAQVTAEQFRASQMALGLTKSRTKLRLFKEWDAPIYLKILEGDGLSAEGILNFPHR